MQLFIDSDAAYLVLPNAKSRIVGCFYLLLTSPANQELILNALILAICKTPHTVVASAAESETTGMFINAQLIIPTRYALESLGHPQLPAPIKYNNSTTTWFANNNMHQKRSKLWDMKHCWLCEEKTQKMIKVRWDKGVNNLADPHTKIHLTMNHLDFRIKNNNILQNVSKEIEPRILPSHHSSKDFDKPVDIEHETSPTKGNPPNFITPAKGKKVSFNEDNATRIITPSL